MSSTDDLGDRPRFRRALSRLLDRRAGVATFSSRAASTNLDATVRLLLKVAVFCRPRGRLRQLAPLTRDSGDGPGRVARAAASSRARDKRHFPDTVLTNRHNRRVSRAGPTRPRCRSDQPQRLARGRRVAQPPRQTRRRRADKATGSMDDAEGTLSSVREAAARIAPTTLLRQRTQRLTKERLRTSRLVAPGHSNANSQAPRHHVGDHSLTPPHS